MKCSDTVYNGGPWEWRTLGVVDPGVAEPGSCGSKPNILVWYLQYLFKCAQSSALLCLRPYVCALMSALLCLRSFVGALLSCALLTGHHYLRQAIFGQFYPPSSYHTLSHPGTPQKYVTHLGPPPDF